MCLLVGVKMDRKMGSSERFNQVARCNESNA